MSFLYRIAIPDLSLRRIVAISVAGKLSLTIPIGTLFVYGNLYFYIFFWSKSLIINM